VAWYSIDDTDNAFDAFFRYFLTALFEAEGGLERLLGPLLQGQARLTEDDVVPTVIHTLNTLSGDLHVILDDYHMITVNAVHSAVARLLKYLPPKVHVVVVSRHTLPQSLCRFRSQYDLMAFFPLTYCGPLCFFI
jgi:LuxR family transcriptional regulator, maltose regulon positive regulatory protein